MGQPGPNWALGFDDTLAFQALTDLPGDIPAQPAENGSYGRGQTFVFRAGNAKEWPLAAGRSSPDWATLLECTLHAIGRSARILSSVSLNSLVHSLSEFGLSLTIAAHQRLH